MANLKVFISYSWDDEQHKRWVLNLANRLCSDGIDVTLDQYLLHIGKSFQAIIENSLDNSDKVIIVFTPNYLLKAENRQGGVGHEYSIINAELYQRQLTTAKFIPLLRKGSVEESIPRFLQTLIYANFIDDDFFEEQYSALLDGILELPPAIKPVVGALPERHLNKIKQIQKESVVTQVASAPLPALEKPNIPTVNKVFLAQYMDNNKKWGYVDYNTKKIIIPCQYEGAKPFMAHTLAAVKLAGKWGYINHMGQVIIPFKYEDSGFFSEGYCSAMLNGKWGYIDEAGNVIIPFKYKDVGYFSAGLVGVKADKKWGYIDDKDRLIIPFKYDDASAFSEDMAAVQLNDKWGYIDKKGNLVIPHKYLEADSFNKGLAVVAKFSMMQLLRKKFSYDMIENNSYGYIDKNDNVVIPFIYQEANYFKNGLAEVVYKGKRQLIDRTGKITTNIISDD